MSSEYTRSAAEITQKRAAQSLGRSSSELHRWAATKLSKHLAKGQRVLDVGAGQGQFAAAIAPYLINYEAIDALRYETFPREFVFHEHDLNHYPLPFAQNSFDHVVSIETIEHLENPRAFTRELVRILKPGGILFLTTPNQLSWLSKLTLLCKNQFNAFQAADYPAHISALLEIDLRRIAQELNLADLTITYSGQGRIPGTSQHYPRWLSGLCPRAFSDNISLLARKP